MSGWQGLLMRWGILHAVACGCCIAGIFIAQDLWTAQRAFMLAIYSAITASICLMNAKEAHDRNES